MMLVRLILAFFIASAIVVPASAAPPSITGYFAGTWACDSALGSQGTKVYGLANGGQELLVADPFVSPTQQFGQFTQTYVQDDQGITVTQSSGPATFTASSAGWDGDTLTFLGTMVNGIQTTPERETYRRADADHFTQLFETGTSSAGPWKTISQSTCLRIKAATPVAVIAGDTNATALQKLATRMAGPGAAKIYVGKLPDDWKATAPLPSGAKLVGSVERGTTTQLYYDFGPGGGTIADYAASLQSAGWVPNATISPGGGFASPSLPSIYCGAAGKPVLTITQPSGPDRSFAISLANANPLCNAQGPLGIMQSLRGPLPTLAAPENATMTGSVVPFRFGATGAKIVSKAPLASLIESFGSQMVAAKWQRLDSAVGAHTATASFTLTDEHGVPWEAVITIYAAPGVSDTYYSLIDTTNLNGENSLATTLSAPQRQTAIQITNVPSDLVHAVVRSDGSTTVIRDGFPYISAYVTTQSPDGKNVWTMRSLAQLAVTKHVGIAVYYACGRCGRSRGFRFSLGAVSLIARNIWEPRVGGPLSAALTPERVVSRTPSLDELPAELRSAIAQYLRKNDKVVTPKIALMAFASSGKARTPYMLAPNLPSTSFSDKQTWLLSVKRLQWFIPGNERLVQPPAGQSAFATLFNHIAPVEATPAN
jgi:hypothetical protein